jgi:hypothetical protein
MRNQLAPDAFLYVYNQSGRGDVQNNYYLPRRISKISMQRNQLTYQELRIAIANFDTSTIKSCFSKFSNSDFFISLRKNTNSDTKFNATTKQIIELDSRQLSEFKPKVAYEASVKIIKRTNVNETFHHYRDSALCILTFSAPDSLGEYKFTLKGTPDNTLSYKYNHFLLREKSELVLSIDSALGKSQITRINNFAADN